MQEVLIRETNHLTWEIGLFFILLILMAVIKKLNPSKFDRLIYFWKPAFFESESSRTKWSTLKFEDAFVFLFRGLVFAGFSYALLQHWGFGGHSWVNYNTLLAGWMVYCAVRSISEWGVGLGFGTESWMLHMQLRRASLKAKLSFVLLLLYVIGVFGFGQYGSHWNVILGIYIILYLWIYHRFAKPFYSLIQTQLIYFILYICTFEIAPLWLIVKYLKV